MDLWTRARQVAAAGRGAPAPTRGSSTGGSSASVGAWSITYGDLLDDGVREEGNDLGHSLPPFTREHRYRYRANAGEKGRFPVNVEFFFIDPAPDNPSGKARLDQITITRAYPYLTPATRKKKREEQNQKKRQTYGYMDLCTGATCPESGVWEGWTKEGPTDVMRFERGQQFDAVRTVSLEQGGSCPMVPGQWFWLCSVNEETGTVWKGIALKG
jgi:hypothetical protein